MQLISKYSVPSSEVAQLSPAEYEVMEKWAVC
jgi:hypothetical protein